MIAIQEKSGADVGVELKWLEFVAKNVKSLRYGAVKIIVQDSRVIQIEKTERLRLDRT